MLILKREMRGRLVGEVRLEVGERGSGGACRGSIQEREERGL